MKSNEQHLGDEFITIFAAKTDTVRLVIEILITELLLSMLIEGGWQHGKNRESNQSINKLNY